MYYLKTEAAFDSAHFLKDYQGKCKNLHGHRWRVIITICSNALKKDKQTHGMLVDFGDLKDSLKPKTKQALLEENFHIEEVPFRPTAENFSRYFFERLKQAGFPVYEATVYETPNNCASYRENEL